MARCFARFVGITENVDSLPCCGIYRKGESKYNMNSVFLTLVPVAQLDRVPASGAGSGSSNLPGDASSPKVDGLLFQCSIAQKCDEQEPLKGPFSILKRFLPQFNFYIEIALPLRDSQ